MPATPEPRATGPLGPAPEAPPPVNAPYGMRPGQRHLLPGISNVANPPPRLDTSGDFELVAPSGAVIPVRSQNSRDKEIVTKLGQSLFNGSANEREQAVARAVTEWGQSIVGQMPIQDIQKIMAERWDHNVGNVVKRDVSRDRIDAALANKGANNRNPNLLGKDDAAAVGKQFEMENAVSDRYQRNNKGSAINVMVGNFNRLEALIDSDSPMAQRVAPMIELLELTGKASVESERAGVMQAAGKWDSWINKLKLLNPADTSMTDAYREAFKQYLQTEMERIMKQKKDLAIAAANSAEYAVSRAYGPEAGKASARRVYADVYGEWSNPTFNPDTDQAPGKSEPIARPGMAPKPAPAPAPKAAPKAAAPVPKAAPPAPRKPPPGTEDL